MKCKKHDNKLENSGSTDGKNFKIYLIYGIPPWYSKNWRDEEKKTYLSLLQYV